MQSAECSEQIKTVNNRFYRSAAARGCKKSVDNGFPPSVTEPQRDANAQKQGAIRVECTETRSATMFQELVQSAEFRIYLSSRNRERYSETIMKPEGSPSWSLFRLRLFQG